MNKQNEYLFFSKTYSFIEDYIPHTNGMTSCTKESYRDALGTFWTYVTDIKHLNIRKFSFSDCTYEFILNYRNWLIDDMKYAPSTVNHRIVVIKAYVHYAALCDVSLSQFDIIISKIPLLTIPKTILPVIDNEKILSELFSRPKNTRLGRRDRLLMSMLFDTAMRVSELVKLTLRDVCVNVEIPYVRVNGKGRKQRIVGLCDRSVNLIKDYILEYHAEYNLDSPFFYTEIHGQCHSMSIRNVQRVIQKYSQELKEDGCDIPDNVSPHMLRRTRATLLLQNGVSIFDVADILGHSSAQTTSDHYARSSMKQKREMMNKATGNTTPAEQMWPDDMEEFKKRCGL